MEQYSQNSQRLNKQNLPEKRANKVVTGKVVTKKKSFLSKIIDELVSPDANSVGSYILRDVLIPNAKKVISDIITDGTDIILYGESRKGSRRSVADKVSYSSFSKDRGPSRYDRPASGINYSYDNVILESRRDAEEVLDRMYEILESYQIVRVGDLMDLLGKSGLPTDNSYGWVSLHNAEIVRVRDGYWLKMPRAIPIER